MTQTTARILLPTFNGEKFLPELLESLRTQDHRNFEVLIRDDASTDATPEIIRKICEVDERFKILAHHGQNLGLQRNIQVLMSHSIDVPFVALCDQDDIWRAEKLSSNVRLLENLESKYGSQMPLGVHSDMDLIDHDGVLISPSAKAHLKIENLNPSLGELLAQNIVTGCSLAINQAALRMSLPIPKAALMHDWWIALTLASTGKLAYDPTCHLSYRQHQGNLSGGVGAAHLGSKLLRLSRSPGGPLELMLSRIEQSIALERHLRIKGHPAHTMLHKFHHHLCFSPLEAIREARRFRFVPQGFARKALFGAALWVTQPRVMARIRAEYA